MSTIERVNKELEKIRAEQQAHENVRDVCRALGLSARIAEALIEVQRPGLTELEKAMQGTLVQRGFLVEYTGGSVGLTPNGRRFCEAASAGSAELAQHILDEMSAALDSAKTVEDPAQRRRRLELQLRLLELSE